VDTPNPLRAADCRKSTLRERLLGVSCVCAVLITLAAATSVPGTISVGVTVTLIAMTVVAAHREAVYVDETALSGSVVVITSCIVGLAAESLLPPLLCACAAALHREHLRDKQLLKISVNLAGIVVPTLCSALLFRALASLSDSRVVAAAAAVLGYWLLNNAFVGLAMRLVQKEGVPAVRALIRSDTVMLAFGFGGAVCGLVMVEVGPWIGITTLVALLAVLDVFVISVPAGLASLRAAWQMVATRGVAGAVSGTVGAVLTRWIGISLSGAIAGFAIGVLAGLAVIAAVVGLRMLLRHDRLDVATLLGIVVVEAIVPLIATVAGVVTAVAGLDIGLLVASALVLATTALVALRRHRAAKRPVIADEDDLMAAVVEALVEGLPVRDH